MRKMDRKSWLIGFALGLCGKPLPVTGGKKEPVAYKYGIWKAQDINEIWPDKETYPKSTIAMGLGFAHVYFYSGEFQAYEEAGKYGTLHYWGFTETETVARAFMWDGDEQWTEPGYVEMVGGFEKNAIPIWSNVDIYSPDGTLYLAASEPVPVYE